MRTYLVVAVSFFVLSGLSQVPEIADESGFDAAMKDVGKTFGAVRESIEARDGEQTAAGAEHLVEIFTGVKAFLEAHDADGAASIAEDARQAASDLKAAVDNQDFPSIPDIRNRIGGTCASCHNDYREENPDGGYRIKAGVI